MVALLGTISVLLILVVIFMMAKTSELSSELKGDANDFERPSKINGTLLLIFLILGFIGMIYSGVKFIPRLLPEAASEHGVEIEKLFNTTLFFTGIVFVLTQILLFWFAFKYRWDKNRKAFFFAHSNTLEIVWTAIPAIVMAVLVVQGLLLWGDIFKYHDPNDIPAEENPIVVEVTAKQFEWIMHYPGEDGEFGKRELTFENIDSFDSRYGLPNKTGKQWNDGASHDDLSADTLVLVKNRPVFVKLSAMDVLHSFYLPHFRVKMDCVPGIPTNFYFVPTISTIEMREKLKALNNDEWNQIMPETNRPRYETFNYELACAELCGKSHFAMQRYVYVLDTDEEYEAWLNSKKPYYETVVKPAMEAYNNK